MKLHECTLGEHLKIEAVKYAIRAIPSGIYINTNEGDGTIEFWKRTPKSESSSAVMVGILKCKSKVDDW